MKNGEITCATIVDATVHSFPQAVKPRIQSSSSHNATITAKKKKKDLITDKTLLLFHKEHLQQMPTKDKTKTTAD